MSGTIYKKIKTSQQTDKLYSASFSNMIIKGKVEISEEKEISRGLR